MLKQRVQTALVVGPLLIAAILLLPSFWLGVLLLAAVGAAAWELSRLGGYDMPAWLRGAFTGLTLILAAGVLWTGPDILFLWLGVTAWFAAIIWLINPEAAIPGWVRLALGVVILITGWAAVVILHQQEYGNWLVLMLFALVVAADVGAYFAGRQFGRKKLAPRISPGKTWAGVGGGLLCALPVALVGAGLLPVTGFLGFVVIGLVTVLFSVVGDLVESLLKRHAGVKDSGELLPGHGGVLDRADSLLAAAPVFLILVAGAGAL